MNRDLLLLIAAHCELDVSGITNDSVLEQTVLRTLCSPRTTGAEVEITPPAASVAAIADGTTTQPDVEE